MKKGKIINFEWLCDNNHYDANLFDKAKIKIILDDISLAHQKGYNLILGIYLIDGFLYCEEHIQVFLDHMNAVKQLADNLKIEIIILSGQGETLNGLPFKSLSLDYTLRMTANSCSKFLDKITDITYRPVRFLYPGGMSTRPNRIGLMNRFYKKNMLKYANWSFFPPRTVDDNTWCRNYLKTYSDVEYNNFIKFVDRSFDNCYQTVLDFFSGYENSETTVLWYDVSKTDFMKNPTFLDPCIYNNTAFSVISEGPNYWTEDNAFCTEKTWRTILYKHPFVFAGHPDQFRYLKTLEFKTFEEYMLIKDYAYIEDEEKRLDAVVKNTKYFLEKYSTILDNIKNDVEYNQQLLLKLIKDQETMLEKFKNEFNISSDEVDWFFNQTGYSHLIRNLPYGI